MTWEIAFETETMKQTQKADERELLLLLYLLRLLCVHNRSFIRFILFEHKELPDRLIWSIFQSLPFLPLNVPPYGHGAQ